MFAGNFLDVFVTIDKKLLSVTEGMSNAAIE